MTNEKYDKIRASHTAGMILAIEYGISHEKEIQGNFIMAMDYKAKLEQHSEKTTAALKHYLGKLPKEIRITFEQNNGLYNEEPRILSDKKGNLDLKTMRRIANMETKEGLLKKLISS